MNKYAESYSTLQLFIPAIYSVKILRSGVINDGM
jgi:hypothetical protein